MIRRSEMLPPDGPHQLDQQHGHTHRHMKPVETSQHEEGGTVNAGVQRQAIQRVGLVILGSLQAQEDQREAHSDTEP